MPDADAEAAAVAAADARALAAVCDAYNATIASEGASNGGAAAATGAGVAAALGALPPLDAAAAAPEQLAVRCGQLAVALEPTSDFLWAALGRAAAAAGDPGLAEHAWARSLQLNAKNALAWVQLGRLYARQGEGTCRLAWGRLGSKCYVNVPCVAWRWRCELAYPL